MEGGDDVAMPDFIDADSMKFACVRSENRQQFVENSGAHSVLGGDESLIIATEYQNKIRAKEYQHKIRATEYQD